MTAAHASRPRVICHMLASTDGRIATPGWPLTAEARQQYELVHAHHEPGGWICGRVTMEPFAMAVRTEQEVAREHTAGSVRGDVRAPGEHDAIDARGRLAWESRDISGDHVVAILSERLSDEYLAFLRQRGVACVPVQSKRHEGRR